MCLWREATMAAAPEEEYRRRVAWSTARQLIDAQGHEKVSVEL